MNRYQVGRIVWENARGDEEGDVRVCEYVEIALTARCGSCAVVLKKAGRRRLYEYRTITYSTLLLTWAGACGCVEALRPGDLPGDLEIPGDMRPLT